MKHSVPLSSGVLPTNNVMFVCHCFRRQYGTTTDGIDEHHPLKGQKFAQSKRNSPEYQKQPIPHNHPAIGDFRSRFG